MLPSGRWTILPFMGMSFGATSSNIPADLRALIPLLDNAKLIDLPAEISVFLGSCRFSNRSTLYPRFASMMANKGPVNPEPMIVLLLSPDNFFHSFHKLIAILKAIIEWHWRHTNYIRFAPVRENSILMQFIHYFREGISHSQG